MDTFRRLLPVFLLHFLRNVPGATTFNASADAELIKSALLSDDLKTVVKILTLNRNEQRMDIADTFKKKFGKVASLAEELDHSVDDEVKNLLVALIQLPLAFYAGELNTAMVGGGQRDEVLIEILCTLNSGEIWAVSNAYKSKFNRTLIEDVEYYTGGELKDFLSNLLTSNRDESKSTNKNGAVVDAKKLYEAGVGKLGTDEIEFYDIFSTRNYEQLRLVFIEYNKCAGHDIEDAIQSEFSKSILDALLTFVSATKNLTAHFATLLHKSVFDKEHYKKINRVVVARSEIDMDLIEKEYSALYLSKLTTDISVNIKGLYKDALLNLISLHLS